MSRRVFVNLIAFLVMFAVMLWWAVNNIISFDFIEQPYQIQARFEATAGVSDNSEVAYLGVHYGSVRSVEPVQGAENGTPHVLVTMDIDRDRNIPEGSTAHIFRKSAVGEPYVDFRPPESFDGDKITDDMAIPEGTVLGLDETTEPIEFSELLRSASRVLEAVDAEDTQTLIHELAMAVDGRGDTLRTLTIRSDSLLETFAEHTDLFDSLSSNSAQLTRTVAERSDSLSSAITDLVALSETLETIEPNTKILLDRGRELLSQTADLVAAIKGNADCLLKDLDDVIEVAALDENLATTDAILERLEQNFSYAFMARDEGPGGVWLRVQILLTETGNPPDVYVPHTELPAVPTVPECVSTLAGSGGEVTPAAASSAASPGTSSGTSSGTTSGTSSVAPAAASSGTPSVASPVPGTELPATGSSIPLTLASALVAGALMALAARPRRS